MKKQTLALLAGILILAGCTKPLIYGKDRPVDPVSQAFPASEQETYTAAKEVLKTLGYKIAYDNQEKRTLKTGWRSTSIDSHYVELFGRPDYGTVGAYYQLVVEIGEREGKSEVTITAQPRSIVPNLKSSGRVEKKVLARMADLLRSDDIQVTNIGLQE
ncbi:MAG: hypothetical protein HYS22_04090 [Deltaproteobacteria bacterium]|nr:hypothetical protein [Deltaproteobacteria bacterium]